MNRLTLQELTERARRGVGKVDRDGLRGAALGVTPIHPGTCTPPNRNPDTEGDRT